MDLLAAFRVYVRVAEAGSFSAVAREIGATQPAISRQVAALEEHLGARLIQRTTRSLALDRGRARPAGPRPPRAGQRGGGGGRGRPPPRLPGGLVRLATTSTFGRLYIAPRIPRLLERYPELAIELRIADAFSDLVAEGIDLAIRVTAVLDSSLVARKVGSSRRIAVASAACIAAHGEPQHPSELARLPCIIFTGAATPNEWQFEGPDGPVAVRGRRPVPHRQRRGVREAVLAGLGFAVLPTWFFGSELTDGSLQPVLTGWEPPTTPISAVYPSRRNLAPRTRAVIDFLVDEFRLDPVISDYGEAA